MYHWDVVFLCVDDGEGADEFPPSTPVLLGGGADSQYACKTPGSSQQLKLTDGCHGPKSAASGAAVENAAETT